MEAATPAHQVETDDFEVAPLGYQMLMPACPTSRTTRGSPLLRGPHKEGTDWGSGRLVQFVVAITLLTLVGCSRPGSPDASIKQETPVTSPTVNWPERYRNKPMLVVIDNYALSVVGALPAEKELEVRKIVQRTFGGGVDWRTTVRQTMGWPANVDAEITSNWRAYLEKAKQDGVTPDAAVFARSFGDEFSKY